jgi:hypothetical protein
MTAALDMNGDDVGRPAIVYRKNVGRSFDGKSKLAKRHTLLNPVPERPDGNFSADLKRRRFFDKLHKYTPHSFPVGKARARKWPRQYKPRLVPCLPKTFRSETRTFAP